MRDQRFCHHGESVHAGSVHVLLELPPAAFHVLLELLFPPARSTCCWIGCSETGPVMRLDEGDVHFSCLALLRAFKVLMTFFAAMSFCNVKLVQPSSSMYLERRLCRPSRWNVMLS